MQHHLAMHADLPLPEPEQSLHIVTRKRARPQQPASPPRATARRSQSAPRHNSPALPSRQNTPPQDPFNLAAEAQFSRGVGDLPPEDVDDARNPPDLPGERAFFRGDVEDDESGDEDYQPDVLADSDDSPSQDDRASNVWEEQDLAEELLYFEDVDDIHRHASASEAPSNDSDDLRDDDEEVEDFPNSCANPIGECHSIRRELEQLRDNPWTPFKNAYDFNLCKWFIQSNVAKCDINTFFNKGLGDSTHETSYASAYKLDKQLDSMRELLPKYKVGHITSLGKTRKFWYRDVVEVIQYLMAQVGYDGDLQFKPYKRFVKWKNPNGQWKRLRRYTDIWDSDWAWEVQEHLPDGGTLVPVIVSSDVTQLTDFGGK